MDELFHYRNKAQFPVGRNKEGKIVTGFYAGRTHNIIENRDCALGVRVIACGIPDKFIHQGSIKELLEETGLDAQSIYQKISTML